MIIKKPELKFKLIEQTFENTFKIKIDELIEVPIFFKRSYHPLLDSTKIKSIKSIQTISSFSFIEFENSDISKIEFGKLKSIANKALKDERVLFDYYGIFHKSGVSYNQIDKWIIVHMLRCNMYPKDYQLDKQFTSNLEKLDNKVDWVRSYCGWSKLEVKDYTKCDMNIVVLVKKNINKLDTIYVNKLFYTINSNCSHNLEFSEFSNEILFEILEKRPTLFILELDKIKNKVDYDYILHELESLIHDGIEISKILKSVKKTEIIKPTKTKIIKILQNIEK